MAPRVLDRRFVTEMSGAVSTNRERPLNGGPWPALTGTAIPDADADGMGTIGRGFGGLSPNDDRNGDGYTNLEEYLDYRHRQVMGN